MARQYANARLCAAQAGDSFRAQIIHEQRRGVNMCINLFIYL